jgi:hypothetical protein
MKIHDVKRHREGLIPDAPPFRASHAPERQSGAVYPREATIRQDPHGGKNDTGQARLTADHKQTGIG